jgi:hypothetical protein
MAHSKEYLKELELLHNKKSFGIAANIPDIVKQLIENNEITSVLDFGAGKGLTSQALKSTYDVNVFTYDPVTFPIKLPDKVDLIYSSDVLEHIESTLIDETIQDLSNRAQLYQYHLIACHPAKKSLSDGRNAHLIIEKPEWWKEKLSNIEGWNIIYEEVREWTAKVKKGPPRDIVKYIVLLKKHT